MTSIITGQQLCELIPHSGDMCLLDRVESWDEDTITCYSNSHQSTQHPLMREGHLSSIHVLEYAAQAMAVHGGLQHSEQGKHMTEGYLAAVRNMEINLCELGKIQDELKITATKIISQQGNMIYQFTVLFADKILATGRATVVAVSYNE